MAGRTGDGAGDGEGCFAELHSGQMRIAVDRITKWKQSSQAAAACQQLVASMMATGFIAAAPSSTGKHSSTIRSPARWELLCEDFVARIELTQASVLTSVSATP